MTPAKSRTSTFLILCALGLALRLAGLLFKGTHDLDQIVLEWGAGIEQNGLAHTPIIVYGVLSYVFHGFAFALAESAPRFWWAPQKFFEVLAEIGIFAALFELLPRDRRRSAVWFYWLNPFFILSGAWQGFWDGPHTLAALLAILAIRRVCNERARWVVAGVTLSTGAMFKPQGLIYFVVPLVLYLSWDALARRRMTHLLWLGLGGLASLTLAEAFLIMLGGDPMAIPHSYLIGDIMPNLCNSCISIWRPVTRLLQLMLGQSGPLYELRLPGLFALILDRLILAGTIILVACFGLRLSLVGAPLSAGKSVRQLRTVTILRVIGLGTLCVAALGLLHRSDPGMHRHLIANRYSPGYAGLLTTLAAAGMIFLGAGSFVARQIEHVLSLMASGFGAERQDGRAGLPAYLGVYLVLTFGALVIPQLGTRAHISHTYAGLVLLIPLAVVNRSVWVPWVTMVAVHLYGYLSTYGIGSSTSLPDRDISAYPDVAHRLIARVDPSSYRPLLEFQGAVGRLIRESFPQEPLLSLLSILQFVCVVYVVRELFTHLGRIDRLEVPLIPQGAP